MLCFLFDRYGIECLFRYYSYGLERKFRPELYKDFMTETIKVSNDLPKRERGSGILILFERFSAHNYHIKLFVILKDAESGQMYGLEKFWAFMKYYKHSAELHVDKKLRALLEPFKKIEDFKVYYSVGIEILVLL